MRWYIEPKTEALVPRFAVLETDRDGAVTEHHGGFYCGLTEYELAPITQEIVDAGNMATQVPIGTYLSRYAGKS